MSTMAKIKPLLRQVIQEGGRPDPELWAKAYEHLPGTDINREAIDQAIEEIGAERVELQILRARPETETD
jgi:hypothetical protein